ncbi:MAG: hypothetical protein P4L79_09985 [Legionella sp.]|uniref:hypothetical protein n=1 Tax=Legionella sp. TaxID=459 RepID=UPI0028423A28|nr:hypothetical protein [Legionella sp.]
MSENEKCFGIDLDEYEVFGVFCPNYSNDAYDRMMLALNSIGIESPYDDFSEDKKYFAQYVGSGHERDSSGDIVNLWKKKS